MRYDHLLEPISDAEPCGPDLDEVGDNEFLNYTLGAENRLPEKFLDPISGQPFDRSKFFELKNETKAITGLLERSRDLRLLTLEARFQILSGQLEPFCDCVRAIAALVKEHWIDVNPKGQEGDFTLRQNAVGSLDDRRLVILPLQYATIVRDSRLGSLSLRDKVLAAGKTKPREGERVINDAEIKEILQSETNRAAVDAIHLSVVACRQALASIGAVFGASTDYQFPVSFDLLQETLDEIVKLIVSARPDLETETSNVDDQGIPQEATAQASEASGGGATTAASVTVTVPTGPVASHTAARAALLAAEAYYGRFEPSSPALLLVHQARILVGKPLIAALEILLPERVEKTTMVIDSALAFSLNIVKLRSIMEHYATTAVASDETQEPPAFEASNRAQTIGLLGAVAGYFRLAEPSSPIPILLARAERFSTQNFQAIIGELFPK